MERNWKKSYWLLFSYGLLFEVIAFLTATPAELREGMTTIIKSSSILITDYFALAGVGAAFMNSGLVTLASALLMYCCKMPIGSGTVLTIGLMSGFALFGKNIFNMWFIVFGAFILSRVTKERLSKYLLQSLWANAVGPLISTVFFYGGEVTPLNAFVGFMVGTMIGFIFPLLTHHTQILLHGLNLYNGGMAAGLTAMIFTPVLKSFGYEFNTVTIWATGYNTQFGIALTVAGVILIISGILKDENAIVNYKNILKRSGNPEDDFLVLDGAGAVLINMGVNIIISTLAIIAIGGDLNGGTIGCILTIAGFSAKGKTTLNIAPVMAGVALSGFLRGNGAVSTPAAQLALLFVTTLAPIAGTYGPIPGLIAGFVHSSVVLFAGAGYMGVNLYNNGFCGGLTAIVLHSVFSRFIKERRYTEPSENIKIRTLKIKGLHNRFYR